MTWTDKDNCGGCDHCGMDMDMEPFCTAPEVAKTHPNGLLIDQAQRAVLPQRRQANTLGREKVMTHTLKLQETGRQMVLLALAHLAIERPGWDDVLKGLALQLDNGEKGRPQMYDEFRRLHRLTRVAERQASAIPWRGSVTDLATDCAFVLTPQQGVELAKELMRFCDNERLRAEKYRSAVEE